MLNKRMLTTEDANSVLQHFGKCFIDYFVIDTSLLTTTDSTFAYDFITITRTTGTIGLNIKNELWTGGYKVLNCNIESPTVSVSSTTINVSGTGLKWVVLELELSPDFKHDSNFEMDYEVEYTATIKPFYEDIALTMGFLDGETPVTGMTVTDTITGKTLTTDSDGLVTVVSPIDKAGYHDYILKAENNGVTVDYYFPYKRVQAELPIRLLNNNIYKNKVNELSFAFTFDNKYNITEDMLFKNNHIILKTNGKSYNPIDIENNHFSFEIPVGSADKMSMQLMIGGNDYVDNYVVDFNKDTVYYTTYSDVMLKYELESDNPASTIIFTGDEFNIPIDITNDVNLIFDGICTSNLNTVFSVKDNALFTVSNANFTGKNFITISKGSVELFDSSFNHCTSTIIKGNGDLTVDTCSFVDNNQVLDVEGNVVCSNVLFDLADTTYLDNSKVPFLDVYGDLKLSYCNFNLELTGLNSLGYSYVCCKIGAEYSTNNVDNKKLFVNEAFPVNNNTCSILVESDNYRITSKSNKAFTYTIINTNTVFSNKLNVEHLGDD